MMTSLQQAPTTHALQSWLRLLPWFFGLGLVFWFGSLSQFGINMDQGYALFREDQRIWLSQGRWAIFFFAQYLHPQPVLAYFPHVIYVLCATLAYPFLLAALQLSATQPRVKAAALLSFPLFMAHPLWYFILEFTANTVPTGLGLLATAVAMWLFAGCLTPPTKRPLPLWLSVALQLLLLCLALGLYQSLLFLAATLYMALLLQQAAQSTSWQVRPWLLAAFVLGGSLVVNALLLELLYVLYNTGDDYISTNLHLSQILTNYQHVLRATLRFMATIYMGSSRVYSASFLASGAIIGLALGHLLLVQRHSLRRLLVAGAGVGVIAFIPLTPQVLTGGMYYMPYRTLVAASAPLWLAALYVLIQIQRRPWRYATVALVLLALLQTLHIHGRFNTGTALLKVHDRQLAHAIYQRAATLIPHFSTTQPTAFDIGGGINYHSLYRAPSSSLVGDSFFSKKYDVPIRVGNFMRSQGLLGLEPVSLTQHEALQSEYEDMPAWPAQGAMRVQEGVLLIKLGD